MNTRLLTISASESIRRHTEIHTNFTGRLYSNVLQSSSSKRFRALAYRLRSCVVQSSYVRGGGGGGPRRIVSVEMYSNYFSGPRRNVITRVKLV